MPVMSAGIRSGRELDPVERAVDDVGDRPHEHRLAEARHALEQDVAVGEQAGQRLADEVALADDDPSDLALDGLGALGEGLRGEARGRVDGDGCFHGCLRSAAVAAVARSVVGTDAQFDGSSELK